MTPISRPPLLPPWMPSCSGVVMPRAYQVVGDRGEVLVRAGPVLPQRGLVPLRAVLAAAADVRHDVRPAAGQPGAAGGTAVARRERDLEPAVAVQERGSRGPLPVCSTVVGFVPHHDEVRDPRAVARRRELLVHGESGGVEERGRLPHRLDRAADLPDPQRRRLGEAAGVHEELVAVVGIGAHDVGVAELGYARQRPARPVMFTIGGRRQHLQPTLDVGQRVEEQVVQRPRVVAQ